MGGNAVGRISRFLLLILIVALLASTVSAQTCANIVSTRVTVSANGQATVTMTVNVQLDNPSSALTFPLPAKAENVSMNGASIRTYPSAYDKNVVLADLSAFDGATGAYQMIFSYTLPDVLRTEQNEKTKKYALIMEIPLLCGFEYPVEMLDFTITMPGDVTGVKPSYVSGVMQTGIETIISTEAQGQQITGVVTRQLQDRETVSLVLEVQEEMFPGKLLIPREGNPEIIPMAVFGVLALLYWLIYMRTLPVFRHRRTTLIEGVTAGELGCRLTAAGADLTMMVFSWAQLGYVRIRVDRSGRIFLEKRMEMGNERTDFELKTFRALFSRGDTVEATGMRYAKLFRQVNDHIPGIQEMYTKRAGNVKIFRILCCGVSVFCGICFAMNLIPHGWLQLPVKILLIVVGAITGWAIQDGMYKFHIRGKIPVYVGAVCGILWIVLGIVSGVWLIGLVTVAVQNLAGLAAAYGGRRSDLGRYNASEILGVRHYLKHVGQEELDRLVSQNPDYFFDMLPYAIALGVDTPFAKAFGNRKIPDCTYLAVRKNEKRSAVEWAYMVRKLADRMDSLQRKMELETWIPVSLNGPADTGRPAPAWNSRNAGRRDSHGRSGRPASDRSSRNGSGSSASRSRRNPNRR